MNTEPKVWNKHHRNAPADAVYIGRGSKWGNPFEIGKHGDRDQVIKLFSEQVKKEHHAIIKAELKGKHLVCFCAPKACHGDLLLKIANS